MSLSAMKAVFDHSATRNGARLVLLALADVADDEGVVVYADYSIGDIAAKCNLSERQVSTILRDLEGGELAVERATGRGNTHQYKILLPGLEAAPHRRRKGEKTSPFPKPSGEAPEKGEVSCIKGEVSCIKGEVISPPLRNNQSTNYQTPLPPSSPGPAACLPDGQAAGPPIIASACPPDDPPADPLTEKFRRAVMAAFGGPWFAAWFAEAAITAPGEDGALLIETGSALRAERLGNQYAAALAALWAGVAGGAPPRVRTRVCPAMREAREACAKAAEGAGHPPDRAGAVLSDNMAPARRRSARAAR